MAHDFELYSNNQEQHIDYQQNQSFMPSSTFGMDHTFTAPFDHMAPLSEAPRLQDLHFHYDAIAQGVKPYQYQTPAGSPHSTSHSFHEMPPVLSASSESGASVSSSAMGSPSLVPQFDGSWQTMPVGLTSGYEYPGMVANDKSYVGKSTIVSSTVTASSSLSSSCVMPSMSPISKSVFKTPVTPASANRSSARSNSLCNKTHQRDSPSVISSSTASIPRFSKSFSSCWLPSILKDYMLTYLK
jgi:hypothetical protein